jgi:hypothetical protein
MRKRHIQAPLLPLTSAFAICLLLIVGSSFLLTPASAGPVDGVTGPVNEVTAPVKQATDTVVPPVVTAPPPPAAEAPEVQVPEVPVKVPPVKVTAKHVTGAVIGAGTKAAGTATSGVNDASGEVEKAAGNTTKAVQTTTSIGTTAATENVVGAGSTALSAGSRRVQTGSGNPTAGGPGPAGDAGARGTSPPVAGAVPAAGESPGALASVPARLLNPFIRVWPAVALTVERSLGNLLGHWSRSVLALFEEKGTGSLSGEGGALADSAPVSHPGDQPPFSWFSSPALQPFNWVATQSALVVLILLTVLGAATMVILALMRREIGLPMFRRGNRFPWRG